MCYCKCLYEEYPWGYNEGCVCRKPKYEKCPMDEDIEDDNIEEDIENEDEEDIDINIDNNEDKKE